MGNLISLSYDLLDEYHRDNASRIPVVSKPQSNNISKSIKLVSLSKEVLYEIYQRINLQDIKNLVEASYFNKKFVLALSLQLGNFSSAQFSGIKKINELFCKSFYLCTKLSLPIPTLDLRWISSGLEHQEERTILFSAISSVNNGIFKDKTIRLPFCLQKEVDTHSLKGCSFDHSYSIKDLIDSPETFKEVETLVVNYNSLTRIHEVKWDEFKHLKELTLNFRSLGLLIRHISNFSFSKELKKLNLIFETSSLCVNKFLNKIQNDGLNITYSYDHVFCTGVLKTNDRELKGIEGQLTIVLDKLAIFYRGQWDHIKQAPGTDGSIKFYCPTTKKWREFELDSKTKLTWYNYNPKDSGSDCKVLTISEVSTGNTIIILENGSIYEGWVKKSDEKEIFVYSLSLEDGVQAIIELDFKSLKTQNAFLEKKSNLNDAIDWCYSGMLDPKFVIHGYGILKRPGITYEGFFVDGQLVKGSVKIKDHTAITLLDPPVGTVVPKGLLYGIISREKNYVRDYYEGLMTEDFKKHGRGVLIKRHFYSGGYGKVIEEGTFSGEFKEGRFIRGTYKTINGEEFEADFSDQENVSLKNSKTVFKGRYEERMFKGNVTYNDLWIYEGAISTSVRPYLNTYEECSFSIYDSKFTVARSSNGNVMLGRLATGYLFELYFDFDNENGLITNSDIYIYSGNIKFACTLSDDFKVVNIKSVTIKGIGRFSGTFKKNKMKGDIIFKKSISKNEWSKPYTYKVKDSKLPKQFYKDHADIAKIKLKFPEIQQMLGMSIVSKTSQASSSNS